MNLMRFISHQINLCEPEYLEISYSFIFFHISSDKLISAFNLLNLMSYLSIEIISTSWLEKLWVQLILDLSYLCPPWVGFFI